eukprot:gnl/Trimastix_PCT/1801.p1 GENE.gnl/Trimastix_PCT/1801~~gnl/Trimastix_PCT/1801.p1  ORF type:complete len:950 (+),score=380.64 gnl/Trimastix_PCT/1801:47-2896(+)
MDQLVDWNLRERNFDAEKEALRVAFHPAARNPLEHEEGAAAQTHPDPLSNPLSTPSFDEDPLSHMAAHSATEKQELPMSAITTNPYLTAKNLERFTELGGRAMDRFELRLEQLDDNADHPEQVFQMTFQDVIDLAVQRKREMVEVWARDERVRTLKIVIQCCKLLSDVTFPLFYPRLFSVAADVLDKFGQIVYERIATKAFGTPNPAPFDPCEVSDAAKETCRNWFFKIDTIRELLPRLFIELSLIKSFAFLVRDPYEHVFRRISCAIRGVGHPLVAAYLRAYLAKKMGELIPHSSALHRMNAMDLFRMVPLFNNPQRRAEMERIGVDFTRYLDVLSPPLQATLHALVHSEPTTSFLPEVFNAYTAHARNTAVVLLRVLEIFPADQLAPVARDLPRMAKETAPEGEFPDHRLFAALGKKLAQTAPRKADVLPILNDVWRVVTKMQDPRKYIEVVQHFIAYPVKYCSDRETNIMLGDVVRHVSAERAFETLSDEILMTLRNCASAHPNVSCLLAMDHYLPLYHMLPSRLAVEAAKEILASLRRSTERTTDPLVIHAFFEIAKTAASSIDSTSYDADRAEIEGLIAHFVHMVDFGRDVERHLSFFVDCRRAFSLFERVKLELVVAVCTLAIRTWNLAGRRHTAKTAGFVKACLAYCQVTIPSIEGVPERLRAFLLSGQVALCNNMLAQADTFLRIAISLVGEVPPVREVRHEAQETETWLRTFLCQFASTLVLVPGHPQHGPFYLIRGLVNAVMEYTWDETRATKGHVYVAFVSLLAALSQRRIPYRIAGVDSNDELYQREAAYLQELNRTVVGLVGQALKELQRLNTAAQPESVAEQARLALALYDALMALAELNPQSAELAFKLVTLASKKLGVIPGATGAVATGATGLVGKRGAQAAQHLQNCIKALKARAERDESPLAQNLLRLVVQGAPDTPTRPAQPRAVTDAPL